MTDHLTISRKLALAIGWKPEQMRVYNGKLFIGIGLGFCEIFDYRDELIALRVAERYKLTVDFQMVGAMSPSAFVYFYRDTVQESIAACVIAAQGVK